MPMFIRKDIPISENGSAVEVEVICGFAHHFRFECDLFDNQGNNPQPVTKGSSLETDPPPFVLNVVPAQLIGRFLMVSADVFNLGTSNNLRVEAVFRQNQKELDRVVAEGTFTDVITVSLVGRFTK